MKRLFLVLALLTLTACGVPLTGDPIADCLNARNQVIQAENAASIANGLLVAAIAADRSEDVIDALQAGVAGAQSNLLSAHASVLRNCAPITPPAS